MKKKRVILCGPAASGKDYFRDFLSRKEYKISVSKTTRSPRDGEKPGYTYDFMTEEDFMYLSSNDKYKEEIEFNGKRYATTNESWEEDQVFIMTPSGLSKLEGRDLAESIVVYFQIPYVDRFNRLDERSDSDTIQRRMSADTVDFMDFDAWDIRVTKPTYSAQDLLETILCYAEI
jgi:guanylate kinase